MFFFFNDTATTEIYTLSLHDALPIWFGGRVGRRPAYFGLCLLSLIFCGLLFRTIREYGTPDRKSTRLNSSHGYISYAVFCLKKKTSCVSNSYRSVSRLAMCG